MCIVRFWDLLSFIHCRMFTSGRSRIFRLILEKGMFSIHLLRQGMSISTYFFELRWESILGPTNPSSPMYSCQDSFSLVVVENDFASSWHVGNHTAPQKCEWLWFCIKLKSFGFRHDQFVTRRSLHSLHCNKFASQCLAYGALRCTKAMYGVYDGHGPAGHDCSDLSLRLRDQWRATWGKDQ